MAGLYIHIPFCKSRCIYCGFYSTTHHELQQRYVDAVCREIVESRERKEGSGERIETLYLGGGTPSQLTGQQLQQLFQYINKVYGLSEIKEITMECNPDDLTEEYVCMLKDLPVNRVSMGVQTFSNERLRFLHRRHSAEQIPIAVERLRKAGLCNISIDLMFGFPDETLTNWQNDIDKALKLEVEHLSAYSLMYEEGTPLYSLLEAEQVNEIDEELSRHMFASLIDSLTAAGYEHYEISNFAKPGFRSRHNSSYWNQTPYIGLGAAAHSYDGVSRRWWNTDDLTHYIEGMESGLRCYEEELLDADTRYNEMVMTALRTCEGLNIANLSTEQAGLCLQQAQQFIHSGLLTYNSQCLKLTREGLFVSNMIMSELMLVK